MTRRVAYQFGMLALLCIISQSINGQDAGILDQLISPKSTLSTIQDHLDHIDLSIEGYSLSYSTSRFESNKMRVIHKPSMTLRAYLQEILKDYNIALLAKSNKILIVVQGEKIKEQVHIFGYIRDIETGEVLVGASIFDQESQNSTQSNHAGYYNLVVNKSEAVISVRYLGFSEGKLALESIKEKQHDISLNFNNKLNTVVISHEIISSNDYWEGGEKIELISGKYASVSGDSDLFEDIKVKAGVQSGSEGQGGFMVRGGAADQNLILLDGVAMYEVSHTAGISSIFIEESIREAILVKNGFSSEFGGRMSSVLDINLKDGHYKEVKGTVGIGLFGGKIHLEGPLQNGKTSFNISAKTSWVNTFLNSILQEEAQYDGFGIKYGDITVKFSHRFTPTSRISYSFYTGNDNIQIDKSEEYFDSEDNPLTNNFRFREKNTLDWGSTVHALNFDQVFGDKWFWQVHAGRVIYDYYSNGFYRFVSQDDGVPDTRILDVTTQSGISDNSFSSSMEYYINGDHRLKFGINYINHHYKPTLKQSDITIQDFKNVDESNSRTYKAHESGIFVDDNYLIKSWWRVNSGLRLSTFEVDDKLYLNLEPRFLSSFYLSPKLTVDFSYSKMTQNVHLLVNPGIGLPSDLWVPSTQNLAPEISQQLSISANYSLGSSINLYASTYIKKQENVIDYSGSEDLFFTILNDDKVTPLDLQSRGWEERVSSGIGEVKGVELAISKNSGFLKGWTSYTLSKTSRTFEDINDGESFPYRFDRRHDFNTGINLTFSKKFDFTAKWVYGSGYAITLALEEIKTIFGTTVLIPNGRNNIRMSPYHHLDLQFNYHIIKENSQFDIKLGFYNSYNRLNQYYIYLYNNRLTGESSFRPVSLFPFLPSLNLVYKF